MPPQTVRDVPWGPWDWQDHWEMQKEYPQGHAECERRLVREFQVPPELVRRIAWYELHRACDDFEALGKLPEEHRAVERERLLVAIRYGRYGGEYAEDRSSLYWTLVEKHGVPRDLADRIEYGHLPKVLDVLVSHGNLPPPDQEGAHQTLFADVVEGSTLPTKYLRRGTPDGPPAHFLHRRTWMYILTADLGGTNVKAGLVVDGRVVGRRSWPTNAARLLAPELPTVVSAFRSLCADGEICLSDCAGIGMSLACLTDAQRKVVLGTARGKFEDAPALDLPRWAAEEFGLPFHLESDSRCAVLGEWRHGAGRGLRSIVMVSLGTAIGVGVVLQGHLLRGVHSQAGLGGHFIVRPGGRQCTCGAHGCVTAETATWALPEILRENPAFSQSALATEEHLDYATLFRVAASGDTLAREVCARSMDLWGVAIVSLIYAFDPEVVILGGGILRSADVILPHVQEIVMRECWTPWGTVSVRRALSLDDAALLGASSLVEQSVKSI